MGGLGALSPGWAAIFGFFVVASAGLPGLSGFVGEFLVLLGAFQFNPLTAAVAALVMILAAAYLLWMFQRVAMGEPSEFLKGLGGHLTDISRLEVVTLLPLGAAVVVLGLLPGLVLEFVEAPVESVLHDAAAGSALAWDPLVIATAVGVVVLAVVVRLAGSARGVARRRVTGEGVA
jgi:NADH-quinone oxidoreductase subunit M